MEEVGLGLGLKAPTHFPWAREHCEPLAVCMSCFGYKWHFPGSRKGIKLKYGGMLPILREKKEVHWTLREGYRHVRGL